MDKSAATQLHRIVINASAQAVWDAITLPEWTEKYGYGGRVEYELKPWVLSDLKSLLETGKRMPV